MKVNDTHDLKNRIFNTILNSAIAISILSIIGNYFCRYPFYINIKWFIIILLSLVVRNLMHNQEKIEIIRLIYFFIIIVIIIPIGYIDSGGSNSSSIAYLFLTMLCITFFFKGKLRCFSHGVLIVTVIALLLTEHYYPQIIHMHSADSQFYDRLIQIPVTLTVGYVLLKQFADAYNNEKAMLEKYSYQLQKANKELDYMANHDSLTGMYNRRMFDKKLDMVFTDEQYQHQNISIVLFDIDQFKHFNDTYGHGFGDVIICELAKITTNIMPKGTIVSRWGGDEFAMIVFLSPDEIRNYVNQLYNNFQNLKLKEVKQATISMGITQISAKDTKKQVFKRADEALYISKNKGKNQYTVL